MAWIGPTLAAAASAARIAGEVADGQARAASQRHEVQAARSQAASLAEQTAATEEQIRRRNRQDLATRAALAAESGTGAGGSNALIAAQDAALAELEALNARYEGQRQRGALENRVRRLADAPEGQTGLRTGLNALSWLARTGSGSW
jgi:hypothetical protein